MRGGGARLLLTARDWYVVGDVPLASELLHADTSAAIGTNQATFMLTS
jgi:hypothetical protein